MLVIKNLNKTYHRKVINHFSYCFKKNNIYAITGPSGCGKSTFLSIISGNNKSYKGNVYYNDIDIKSLKNYTFNNVGYVYQNHQLIDNLTSYENVTLPLILNNEVILEYKIKALFKKYNISHTLNMKVKDISGGEKQRVAIIRSLIKDNEILLLDEPTSALDENNKNILLEHLKEIKKDKIIIIVTHDKDLALSCDEIVNLNSHNEINYKPKKVKYNERKINFCKSKLLYKKVFKNKKIFNYLSTYILSIGLIAISFSLVISTFINQVVSTSFSMYDNENAITIKAKDNHSIIDFSKNNFSNFKTIYYEGIESSVKEKIKSSNLIDYIDFNLYDISNINFIYDNYLSQYQENFTLSIPSYLSFTVKEKNYINIYFNDNSLSIKIDKIISNEEDQFIIYCNNTSYLNPLYKYYNLDISISKYLYCEEAKLLYNYLIDNPEYNSYLFYLDKSNNVILIIKGQFCRINRKMFESSNNFIVSDYINTYIDYESGFVFIFYNNEAFQVIIDNSLSDNQINISSSIQNKISKTIFVNNHKLYLNKIIQENNYSFMYINQKTFNNINDDLIYCCKLFTKESTNIKNYNNIIINDSLFKPSSFKVFSYISKFLSFFSIILIIQAMITSTYIFTINFMNKKKEIRSLLTLGIYKSKVAKLLMIDPLNNIFSSVFTSIISYILSSIVMVYIYNILTSNSLEITISISLILFLFFFPFFLILPSILIKITAFLKNIYKK